MEVTPDLYIRPAPEDITPAVGTTTPWTSTFDGKFDCLESKVDRKFTWLLSFQVATTAGLLGAMARGFGWI